MASRMTTAVASLAALGLLSAPDATSQPEGWNPQALVAAASSTEQAAKGLLETLRVVVIPAHSRARQKMLGDVVGDAESIERKSRYLARKADRDVSYRHIQKAMHRISRDYQDLKANARLLAVPERFNQSVAQLGVAVRALEASFAGGG